MESEFPSNSKNVSSKKTAAAKKEAEPKVVPKVVQGSVTKKKTPLGRKFRKLFISGDDNRSIMDHVFNEMLIPAAKELFLDSLNMGLERKLFGEVRSSRARRYGGPVVGGQTQYNRMHGGSVRHDPRAPAGPSISNRGRRMHDFGEIVLEQRVEAVAVIDTLFSLLERYHTVTVADLYDAVGLESNFTDQRWGWTDLRGSDVQYTRDGYLLVLPQPELLD